MWLYTLAVRLCKHINYQYLTDVIFFFSLPWIRSYDGMPTRLQENQCYILPRYDRTQIGCVLFLVVVFCDSFFDIDD